VNNNNNNIGQQIIALINKINTEQITIDMGYNHDPQSTLAVLSRHYLREPSGKGKVGNRILKKLMKYRLTENDEGFYDHVVVDGDILISEPYQINRMGIESLEKFCDLYNLTYMITGESYHYPNATVRIIIKEKN
jgi:hypothetical protein